MARRSRTAYGIEDDSTFSRLVLSDGFDVVNGQAVIRTRQDSTAPENGAVVVAGGVGLARSLWVGDDLHVLARSGGTSQIGCPGSLSGLAVHARVTTDLVPDVDAVHDLGSTDLRWGTLSARALVGGTPDQELHATRLTTHGSLTVNDYAYFGTNVYMYGPNVIRDVRFDTSNGASFQVIGDGDFIVSAPHTLITSREFSLQGLDTTLPLRIATEAEQDGSGVDFEFGSARSTCTFGGDFVLVRGDLVVQGTTTTVASTVVTFADKNLELATPRDGQAASDAAANGGGITLHGTTDKTIAWYEPTDPVHPGAWGFSDSVDVAPGGYVRTDQVRARTPGAGLTVFDGAGTCTFVNGRFGLGTAEPSVTAQLEGVDAIKIPAGTSAQRPQPAEQGMIRWNSELLRYEGFGTGDVWNSLGGVVDIGQTTYLSVLEDSGTVDAHRFRFFASGTETAVLSGTALGLFTTAPACALDVAASDAARLPVGGASQRPADARLGMLRYNDEASAWETYNEAGVWVPLGDLRDVAGTTGISVLNDARSADAGRIRLFVGGTETAVLSGTALGLFTTTPRCALDVVASDALCVPIGTTAQRPAQPAYGMVRWNSELLRYEGFGTGDVWSSLGGVVDISQTTYLSVLEDSGTVDAHRFRFFAGGTETAVLSGTALGLFTTAPACALDVATSDAVRLPAGSSAERPDDPRLGMLRYNDEASTWECYNEAGVWVPLGELRDVAGTTGVSVLNDARDADAGRIRMSVGGTETAVLGGTALGLFTTAPACALDVAATDAARLPVGSSAERPDDPRLGMLRYNNEASTWECYNEAGVWVPLGELRDVAGTTGVSVLNDARDDDAGRIRLFVGGAEVGVVDESGRLGVGTLEPSARLAVAGDAVVGSGFAAVGAFAPTDGILVEGAVAIGALAATNKLDVAGAVAIGASYAGAVTAPEDGLVVQGAVGIGTSAPTCTLDVAATDAVRLPVGDTFQRPDDEQLGMVRYNQQRQAVEALVLVGAGSLAVQTWVALGGPVNTAGDTYATVYDPSDGTSLNEVRVYTAGSLRARVDASGNLGIGGGPTRVLAAPIDVFNTAPEQVVIRTSTGNYASFSVSTTGQLTLAAHATDSFTYGDITLKPAGAERRVIVGAADDVFSGVAPIKLAVYGFLYTSQGFKFPDGTVQTSSATEASGGQPFAQWLLGDITAGVKKLYLPFDTHRVAVGTEEATAKLTVAKAAEEDADMAHLELRASDTRYATLRVDDTGSLFVTAGLAGDSDILLQPTGNVGVNVDSAAASLHVNHDLFLQANNSDDNTTTGRGLYMRFKDGATTADRTALITSGANSTGDRYPLAIAATRVMFPDTAAGFGINTSTPACTLSVQGNLAVGGSYGPSRAAPAGGAIIEGDVGVATYAPNSRMEVVDAGTPHSCVLRATADDANVWGVVAGNATAGTLSTDGLRIRTDNSGAARIDAATASVGKPLLLQPSGGGITVGGTLTGAATLDVLQPGTSAGLPVLHMKQADGGAALVSIDGSSAVADLTKTLVLNDAAVTAARVKAFVKVAVNDAGGGLAAGDYFMPLYSLA